MTIMNYNYHAFGLDVPKSETTKVDELMISNMINFLNNQNLVSMLSGEELQVLLQTVKNHVVLKSNRVLRLQDAFLSNNSEKNKFR